MESKTFEVKLTDDEMKAFDELCVKQNICPSQKIGDLIHGFILAEGVKHQTTKVA